MARKASEHQETIGLIAQSVELRTFKSASTATPAESCEKTPSMAHAGGPSGGLPPRTAAASLPDAAAVLEAAIDRLTRALATASDDVIGDLVAERREMRRELAELRATVAGVIDLDSRRGR